MKNNPSSVSKHPLANKIETALATINRKQFVSSKVSSLVVGHSIPSSDAAKQILLGLNTSPVKKILHIGTGSGYLSALLSKFSVQVIAIEKSPPLVAVARIHFQTLKISNIDIRAADGRKGAQKDSPFDVIIISTPSLKCQPLLKQLSSGGLLLCVEKGPNSLYKLVRYTRSGEERFKREELKLIDFSSSQNDILSEMGLVTPEALQEAKINAKKNSTLIIEELHKLTQIEDLVLYRSLAKQSNLPLGKAEDLLRDIQPSLFNDCSRAFLDFNHLIPIRVDDNVLKLATNNPDASIVDIQHVFQNHKIEKILVTPTDFQRLWSVLDLCSDGSDFSSLIPTERADEEDLLTKNISKPEPHLVSIFEALLLDAVSARASDIHIEQYNERIRIRLRVDGELIDANYYNLNVKELRGLVNVIKLRSDLNIAERRLPQGGRSRLTVGGNIFDLRVQVQPSLHGEHVIIRLLPQSTQTVKIEDLGFSKQIANHYRRLLNNPAGLVLVVGPTGSGKSTTLYAGLQLLADDGRRKVITIEDPIEYSIDNIQQVRVRPEIDFNFSDAMRAFVREDPDVILVGEIRDQQTALEAVRASQTGHVVLSTLHSNDAVDALQRIYDLGIHPNSLASELLAVIAQRLAKKICAHCKEEVQPEAEILQELFPEGAPDNFRCFKGKGCSHCNESGTKGRVAVVEYMQVNDNIRNAISKRRETL